ncbi:MAG: anhydro-N-acetylmuramic acid kinase [Candidatus Eisenbacteria bacterium]
MTAKRKRADEESAPKPRTTSHEERSARPAGVELAHAIGIMTGTSADGIDVALTRIADDGARHRSTLVAFATRPFDDKVRAEILEAQEGTLPLRTLLSLAVRLSTLAAEVAREALSAPAAIGVRVEVVGFHGQTVFHDPRGERSGVRFTAQIGEPSVLAAALGVPVVSNFRMADIQAGGEGAPLVPRFDWNQFGTPDSDRVLLNLGGISNLTRLLPGGSLAGLMAFDCGPANMLLDGIVSAADPTARYDAGGELAARGRADVAVVREFLSDPYFNRKPPKSAGMEEFGAAYRDRFLARTEGAALEDRLRTAVALVAAAVAKGIALSSADGAKIPDEIIVSGGGAKNRTLLQALEAAVLGTRVVASDKHGVPGDAKEAMAFAFLAHETLRGRPGNVPSATGARREVVLGSITPAPLGDRA